MAEACIGKDRCTIECSGEISEYGSKDCPDDEEEEEREYGYSTDEDEELVGGLNELALEEETGQTSLYMP